MTEAMRAVITTLTCERNELESKLRNLRKKFGKLQLENSRLQDSIDGSGSDPDYGYYYDPDNGCAD